MAVLKVMTIFGTRPEAIKLAPVIKELEKHLDKFKSIVVATAQHREMLDQVLDLFAIQPDYDLNIMEEDQSLFQVSSRALLGLEKIVEENSPDVILVEGDTTTVLIGALTGFYHKIPVGHVEAGLRTYNKYNPFPEEINRRLISVLTDLHFAPTQRAKQNLLAEGVNEDAIYVTGNTVIDALLMTLEKLKKDKAKSQTLRSRFSFLSSDHRLILVTAHRRENFGKPLENICWALKEIVEANADVEIIYPVHLNPNIQDHVNRLLQNNGRIHLIEPLDYESFVWLMDKSYLILTDSGGIQEEAPSLGKPVLVLREVTERPEVVEAGTVKVIGTNKDKIIQETKRLLDNKAEYDKMANAINPYGDGKAAERILKSILENLEAGALRCE